MLAPPRPVPAAGAPRRLSLGAAAAAAAARLHTPVGSPPCTMKPLMFLRAAAAQRRNHAGVARAGARNTAAAARHRRACETACRCSSCSRTAPGSSPPCAAPRRRTPPPSCHPAWCAASPTARARRRQSLPAGPIARDQDAPWRCGSRRARKGKTCERRSGASATPPARASARCARLLWRAVRCRLVPDRHALRRGERICAAVRVCARAPRSISCRRPLVRRAVVQLAAHRHR